MDRIAIEQRGISGLTLMRRAGQFAFEEIRRRYPDAQRWLILCGAGNNGGDGFVVAALAQIAGITARVVTMQDPRTLAGDAAEAYREFRRAGGETSSYQAGRYTDAELIVDALFGTGLTRDVDGDYARTIEAANQLAVPRIAIDVPSGLRASDGKVLGVAIRAQLTVTFVGQKLGLYVGDGPEYTGEVMFSGLGIPADIAEQFVPAARLFGAADARQLLPRRARMAHKGSFGHVLVIGGNSGMGGAVRLAGEAALRAGAGLVTVATRAANVAAVTGHRPELMCSAVESRSDLERLLVKATVIAVGPGLGQDDWAREIFSSVVATSCPLVVDADALNLLAQIPRERPDWILTPHPGEAARLLGVGNQHIQADRISAASALATKYGATVLLKGRATVVAGAEEIPWLIDRGNPGMATGGMGDVLTGLVAGLRAQFARGDPADIAALAAWVHASAGDAAATAGERGLVAGDVLEHLRPWLNPGI
jgi:NAD(P)H-hydrate epimerase